VRGTLESDAHDAETLPNKALQAMRYRARLSFRVGLPSTCPAQTEEVKGHRGLGASIKTSPPARRLLETL
jgi:hypothetical protein